MISMYFRVDPGTMRARRCAEFSAASWVVCSVRCTGGGVIFWFGVGVREFRPTDRRLASMMLTDGTEVWVNRAKRRVSGVAPTEVTAVAGLALDLRIDQCDLGMEYSRCVETRRLRPCCSAAVRLASGGIGPDASDGSGASVVPRPREVSLHAQELRAPPHGCRHIVRAEVDRSESAQAHDAASPCCRFLRSRYRPRCGTSVPRAPVLRLQAGGRRGAAQPADAEVVHRMS
jgi:hypothetical protein